MTAIGWSLYVLHLRRLGIEVALRRTLTEPKVHSSFSTREDQRILGGLPSKLSSGVQP